MLGAYFNCYETRKVPHTLGPFDKEGVPMFSPHKLKLKGSANYHPIVIIQYALANYNLWIREKENKYKDNFLKCAYWLVDNATSDLDRKTSIWYYNFDLLHPPIKAPWYSGMAQGQALSVIARAYEITQSPKFLRIGIKAMASFNYTLDDEGCVSKLDDNTKFIQELAYPPAIFILNGCIYGVIGLFDFIHVTNLDKTILEPYINGLKRLIPKYDMGVWSKYSLGMRFHLADDYYHDVHILQLNKMFEISGAIIFKKYAVKFETYKDNIKWMTKIIRFIYLNVNRALRKSNIKKFLYNRPII